jgi:hypothetical protein
VHVGDLIAYGASIPAMMQHAAVLVSKILKGAKPSEIPVEQPTNFELVINLKTAKALGIEVLPSLMRSSNSDAVCAVHESGCGTSQTSRDVRLESAKWAKADIDQVSGINRGL